MKLIQFRVTDQQAQRLQDDFKRSRCRSLADYIRQGLFEGRIAFVSHNSSVDNLANELLAIKNTLWDLRRSFSIVLDPLSRAPDHLESVLLARTLMKSQPLFFQKTEELRELMIKFYNRYPCISN